MTKELKSLEFYKILEKITEHAVSESGKELCTNLRPYKTIKEAEKALQETDEAVVLYIKYGIVSFSDLSDITGSCKRARNGSVLPIPELLKIGRVLYIARKLHDYLKNHATEGIFAEYIERIQPNKYFEDKIYAAFPNEEEVADNASSALRDIRRKQLSARNKIRSILDSYIHSSTNQKYLQENIVTIRNDRYVLPVKAEYRQEVSGLVHDTSSSGATLFIEPMSVVSANNELSVLAAEERREIERILSEFSSEAGDFSENIIENFNIATFFDFIFAKAKYADSKRAVKPILNDKGFVNLKQARHPLIDDNKVVPIDISLGKDYTALIITGPNTGGKTVSLKTMGLSCLMAKSGLFITAKEESTVAFFDNIFADIGDEQSIEQSLSTFSSHMSNIINILKQVTENSLVLLDELGSGTDPAEGAALAIAIIENIQSMGAKLMSTTHYAELKLYAIQTPNVENASCEFDVATLKPTYRLITGIPGKSNAFAIASRLGIDDLIIESAKQHLNNETVKVDTVLADLEVRRLQAEQTTKLAEEKIMQAEDYAQKKKREADELKEKTIIELEKMREKTVRLSERMKDENRRLIDQLEDLRKEKDREDFKLKISAAKAEVKEHEEKIDKELGSVVKREKKPLSRPLVKGDTVKIVSLNKEATVLENPDNKGFVQLQAGIIKTKVKVDDLELIEEPKVKTVLNSTATFKSDRGTRSVKSEIDLRGMMVLEAESVVDEFLNSCYITGLKSVNIIHGKGTGALRAGIHELLKRHHLVESYRLGTFGEGETGVTVVTLK